MGILFEVLREAYCVRCNHITYNNYKVSLIIMSRAVSFTKYSRAGFINWFLLAYGKDRLFMLFYWSTNMLIGKYALEQILSAELHFHIPTY